jgi:hypothetical protein
VDLGNDAEQDANKTPVPTVEDIALEKDKKHAKLLKEQFKNIAEQIQNTFSLYILFNSSVTLDEVIKENAALTSEQLSHIRNCTDDAILYYCYLLVSEHDLNAISDEAIQDIISKHKEIISFLVQHQESVKKPIETLFNNIKDEMKPLKDKLKVEADAFTDAQAFCPTIYNEKYNSILEIIRHYLTPKDKEKHLFGEVFTPIELVCEMLSALPIDLWTNPYLKWLDPANGIGNFPIIVYFKLMVTLKGIKDDTLDLTDEQVRSKHIIEHMLYMNELNPINVALCKKIFQMIDANATPNVSAADFLNTPIFPGKTFDVIVGNPPFSNTFNTGDNKPYLCFTFIALHLLNPKGFLLFITPPAIYDYLLLKKVLKQKCKVGTIKYERILNITAINIDNKHIQSFFKEIGSKFTYFIIEKTDYKQDTVILHKNKAANRVNLEAISNIEMIQKKMDDPIWLSIEHKLLTNANDASYIFQKAMFKNGKKETMRRVRQEHIDDHIVKTDATPTHKYKILTGYTTTKEGTMVGEKIYYYDNIDTDYGAKRLIVMSGPSYLYPYIIQENTYTLSDNVYYLRCTGFNCDNLLYFLQSPLGKYLDSKFRPSKNNEDLLAFLSKLKPLPTERFESVAQIYSFFELSEEEIQYINKRYTT